MNALRVVALRLQNMKGKLEELNEPVDDLMEVSKVQTQILNLTGNQVDIFDSTTQEFRSTYDILKDISEVWDNLSSVNRASLTEILFGKNRANTGLAIIQAFQSGQIESALESSLDSAGTAVEENERLMQSVQASLDALKGSFQDLSNAVMSSGFLKGIIDGASSFLKVLTAIVDKVGALPPLLMAIGTYAGFKNVNFASMLGLNLASGAKNEISTAIANYNQLLAVEGKQAAMQATINGQITTGNAAFNKYIQGLNGASASMSGYRAQLVSSRIETIKLQVETAALNAAISLGISLAVSLAVTAISKLITAQKEAKEREAELREEYAKAAEERKAEVKSINDSLSNYTKIATTVADVADKEERLSDIQDGLIDKFGEKAKALDLVNEKYSEGVEALQRLKLEEAKEYVEKTDRTGAYDEAKEKLSFEGYVEKASQSSGRFYSSYGATLVQGAFNGFLKGSDKAFEDLVEQNFKNVDVKTGVGEIYLTGTLEEQLKTFKEIAQMYKETEGYNQKVLTGWDKQISELEKEIKNYRSVVQEYENAQRIISELELPQETQEQFNKLIDKAKELNNVVSGDGTTIQKMEATQELREIESELYELAGDRQEIQSTIKSIFSEFTTGSQLGIQAVKDLTEAWFEDLDDLKKGVIKNIDAIKSALQTVAGGGKISDSDFWELAKFDTDHILDGAQVVEGQFVLSAEQLVKLKDTYIQKQIESVKLDMEQAKLSQENAEQQAKILQQELESIQLRYDERGFLLNTEEKQRYEKLQRDIQNATENAKQYGEKWRFNNTLLMYYNSNLGNTVDRQKQLTDLTKNLQSEADNLLKAQEYRIDQIIDKYENEKEAIEDAKKVLEDQLAVLEEQEDALKNTIENYKTVAETVQSAIQEQIDKIKEENEERENALDLATKLANLENARNKKVRIYTEAGGWQYEAKKSDVEKAERELEKTKEDERIKLLEAQLKKWQNITDKRQKAEDERLAEEILGADWRLKISEQDEEIFNKYENEYDAYGDQLWQISNVEIATLKKSIEAKDKEIAAKEAQIKEWQKYKSAVQKAANDAKAANEEYMKYLNTVQVDENSSLETRERNLQNFATQYAGIMDKISQYSQQIGSLGGSINIDTTNIEKAATEMGIFIEKYRDGVLAMSEALDASSTGYGIVNSEWDAKLVRAAKELKALRGYANGGVADQTGLAMLHGTKQRSETIFNANDSAKLYDLVHSTPNLVATALTDGVSIARGLTNTSNDSRSVTLNGTTINLPNVQNAEQFARQFESYMQTVLAESQVYKPSR